jgi:hypothetical protein
MKRTRIGGEDAAAVARSADLLLAARPNLRMFGDLRKAGDLTGFGPVIRALMRLEARRLLEDAADFPHTLGSRRGFEDRQFLAVLDLVKALTRCGWRPAGTIDDDAKRDAS